MIVPKSGDDGQEAEHEEVRVEEHVQEVLV
jgi:hypothetical protein